MANHLHMYMNNPTAGGVDGTEISSGNETLPLEITLNASLSEAKAVKVAVRCDSGYQVDGDTSIYFEGENASKWQVAADNEYSGAEHALNMALWQTSLDVAGVSAANKIFWVKATSSSEEEPQNDRTVNLIAEGLVSVAE